MISKDELAEIEVVLPSLGRRYSGVTASLISVASEQVKHQRLACFGQDLGLDLGHLGWLDLFRLGLTKPRERRFRIWHARRNNEMALGLLLRLLSPTPWKLVMTSALPRRPTWVSRFLLKRMDLIIAVREGILDNLPDRNALVVYHGVDTELWVPAVSRAEAWQALGIGGTRGIACFGRLRPSKGTDLFVKAMIQILPAEPELHAVLVGLTKPEDQAFVDHLKAEIRAASLGDRIHFLGFLDPAKTRSLAAAVSLVVAPSRTEGFGLTPLEAMASGTPVVASQAGAYPQMLEGISCGGNFSGENIDELAGLIRQTLSDPRPSTEISQLCRDHILARFSIQIEVESIVLAYQNLKEIARI